MSMLREAASFYDIYVFIVPEEAEPDHNFFSFLFRAIKYGRGAKRVMLSTVIHHLLRPRV
jgi:hypothetical protein